MSEQMISGVFASDGPVEIDVRPGTKHPLAPFGAVPWTWFDMGWIGVLTEGELKVALGICKYVNRQGVSKPSVPTICKDTGLHPSTVSACIGRLESYKLIRAVRQPGKLTQYHVLHPHRRPAFTREGRRDSHEPLADGRGVARGRGLDRGLTDPPPVDEDPPRPWTERNKEEHVPLHEVNTCTQAAAPPDTRLAAPGGTQRPSPLDDDERAAGARWQRLDGKARYAMCQRLAGLYEGANDEIAAKLREGNQLAVVKALAKNPQVWETTT